MRQGTFVSCLSLALTQIKKFLPEDGPFDFNVCDFYFQDFDTPDFTVINTGDFFICDFDSLDFDI